MKKLGTIITRHFRGRHSNPMWADFVPEEERKAPLPKTFFTGDDCFSKGGPIEGIPVNPNSAYGKTLLENGYTWNGKSWNRPTTEK